MRLPKVFKNSTIYTIITVLQKGISFFLLPIYTTFLSPDDYGIIGVVTSVSSFLSVLLTLGISGAMSRFYYKNQDSTYRRSLYGTIAIVIICNCIFWGGLFIFGHSLFIDPFVGTIPFYPYIFIGLLNSVVTPLYLFFQNYLQTSQQAVKYGTNSMLFFILNIALILISLCYLHWGVLGVLLSNLITSCVFLLYVIIIFLPNLIFKFNIPIFKEWFKYSIPLLPHSLANWSNGMLDRLLVNGIRSQADAGLYNLGQQYGSVVSSIALGINQAYVPWFFEKISQGEKGRKDIRDLGELSSWCMAFLGLILAIFSKEILGLMVHNPAYSEVWKIIPCIIFAFVFQSLYYFFINVLFIKDTKFVFLITVTTIVINIGLNLALIPIYGFVGCAVACVVTYFVKSVIALIASYHCNKEIKFNWGTMYLSSFVGFGVALLSLIMTSSDILVTIIYKTLACILFASYVYYRYRRNLIPLVNNFIKKRNVNKKRN